MRSERCEPLGFSSTNRFRSGCRSYCLVLRLLMYVLNFQDETIPVLLVVQGSSELSTTCEYIYNLCFKLYDACVRFIVVIDFYAMVCCLLSVKYYCGIYIIYVYIYT